MLLFKVSKRYVWLLRYLVKYKVKFAWNKNPHKCVRCKKKLSRLTRRDVWVFYRDGSGQNLTQNLTRPEAFLANPT